MVLGRIASIWRYPVKSLKAHALDRARVDADGLAGDRCAALYVTSEHARTGKTYRGKEHDRLHSTSDIATAIDLAAARGIAVEAQAAEGARYFDAAAVSLIFDCWIDEVCAALRTPLDPLRWRPNFYARAAAGFARRESDLIGLYLCLGSVVLQVSDTIKRCVTTTYDVETGEHDDRVLNYVAQQRGNVMGVYCEVLVAGDVRAGDDVRLRER